MKKFFNQTEAIVQEGSGKFASFEWESGGDTIKILCPYCKKLVDKQATDLFKLHPQYEHLGCKHCLGLIVIESPEHKGDHNESSR